MVPTRVLILGGGSGGLELAAKLSGRDDVAVTLVDRADSHMWKPRLHEFAAGTANSTLTEISFYMLAGMRGFRFEQGEVEAIDRNAKTVRLGLMTGHAGRETARARTIPYDICVVALGGITPDFGTEGVAEYAIRLDGRQDAEEFRRSLTGEMLHARETGEPTEIVIVGSGATGTELAGHLRVAERAFTGEHPNTGDSGLLRITILEAAPVFMPGVDETLRRAVEERLDKLDIAREMNQKVSKVTSTHVYAGDGREWRADLAVWAVGLVGLPILSRLADFETDGQRRIIVDEYLRSSVDEAIYVLGDAASLTPEGAERPLPPTAQCASQQADYLAKAIPRSIAGQSVEPFRYEDKGRLLSLGRGGSVGMLGFPSRDDLFVSGRFASAAYHALQRHHQWTVLGSLRGSVAILAEMISPAGGPAFKLHSS